MSPKSRDPGSTPDGASANVTVQNSPEFAALRKALRRFVFPVTVAFLAWYALYVLLSAYARGFMAYKLVGHINVGLVFGVLQFVSTFLIAWAYSRYADKHLDPKAEAIKRHMDGEDAKEDKA
ncbi:DUF485 domain-containing protein [Stackebrandtia nassauensis]|uniref:DUF485 domain-containing protein n=1 Tax=Stackebrandtia nassauensis (strain DSM 44728 / CIP 108903 / NRRL B-16338 / NBRC 102104 / LLR-40K-21) TaxID=446470 RepID=D3PYN9_STANL|nr:DUF485 domain-containing protein [Stackebrandtia nassauensis]ADD43472.1 protein of unknown function DUF485 [Stackebrandtia nassauensis DSM 44728]